MKEQELINYIKSKFSINYFIWRDTCVYILNLSVDKDAAMRVCAAIGNDEFTKRVDESYC